MEDEKLEQKKEQAVKKTKELYAYIYRQYRKYEDGNKKYLSWITYTIDE